MGPGRVLLLGTLFGALADVYLHHPRGSNNRLNEQSANRNNANRLFDSQNNNRGGYNVGDKTDQAFTGTGVETGSPTHANDRGQYALAFYEGSRLVVEWTNQHGCGGNEKTDPYKLNCNIVIQYTCDSDDTVRDPAMQVLLRDGRNTGTPDDAGNVGDITGKMAQNADKGHHESEAYYYECTRRERNKGLFLADQKPQQDAARFTRQNPNGNRNGLECPEERDYWPYWGPTPWIDIAVLTDTVEDCDRFFNYRGNSQNKALKGKCAFKNPDYTTGVNENTAARVLKSINRTLCESYPEATWATFTHNVDAPVCVAADWSRVNHLGNGRSPQPLTFNWTLPRLSALPSWVQEYSAAGAGAARYARCVLRLRYNISTDDYDPRNTNASQNDNPQNGVVSPVTNNPTINVSPKNAFNGLLALKLAINTNQFGRTFQDRSHVFMIKTRPPGLDANAEVWNLNVRGKRGNIVQTFPSVEYDFVPNQLTVTSRTYIHIQWTGSNTHNNGNPAGDGQAGDAGEGTTGTDRSNFVCSQNASVNYPTPFDTPVTALQDSCILQQSDCWATVPDQNGAQGAGSGPNLADFWGYSNTLTQLNAMDCALRLASSGYLPNLNAAQTKTPVLNPLLNNAYASLVGGVLLKVKTGECGTTARPRLYHYFCTRNNNFSNRSQKGVLICAE